jgi:hypothetical protein
MSISTSVFGSRVSEPVTGFGDQRWYRKHQPSAQEVRQNLSHESVRQRDLTQLMHLFRARNPPGMEAEDPLCACCVKSGES